MKRDAPAAHRNRQPILDVLTRVLPARGTVLEIGSGTGQHAVWFAEALPHLHWQPTERDPDGLASIAAWRDEFGGDNLLPPLRLDVEDEWPVTRADAVVATNVLHASPPQTGIALVAGAARVLAPGAPLVLYGAWREGGATEPSNEAFDLWLKERDPRWGIKDVEWIRAVATPAFREEAMIAMPANNRVLVFRRSAGN